jgi:hypothetical protein
MSGTNFQLIGAIGITNIKLFLISHLDILCLMIGMTPKPSGKER